MYKRQTNKLTRAVVSEMTDYHEEQIHYAQYGVNLPAVTDVVVTSVEPLRILYCGRIEKDQKRCQDLVKIAQGLTDGGVNYQLLIAGDGPYKDQLLSELGSEKVVYLGSIPAEQVSEKAYRQADVLLLTSEWETGPIVIWEALAHGLAVVTSKYSGVKTEGALIDQINCLMFEVGDAPGAVTAITSLLDGSKRRKLFDAGVALIRDRYSRELSVKQWHMVFNEIASYEPRSHARDSKPVKFYSGGRLESLFGYRLAERIRRLLDKPVMMNSAGDEWPHAHSHVQPEFGAQFADRILEVESVNVESREAQVED